MPFPWTLSKIEKWLGKAECQNMMFTHKESGIELVNQTKRLISRIILFSSLLQDHPS